MIRGAQEKELLPPLKEVGQRIKTARTQRKMSVAQLSEKTKISVRYIEYIEAGEFERLPSRTYMIGFTRLLCITLELDHEEVIEVIKSEMVSNHHSQMEPSVLPGGKRALLAKLTERIKSTF